jgi:hypothetical protein
MAADTPGSTSSANSPYLQFFDSRALYSIATNPDTFQKTYIYTKAALHPTSQLPTLIPSHLNTFIPSHTFAKEAPGPPSADQRAASALKQTATGQTETIKI